MNKERMLQLADFLENLPEEKFNMETWAYSSSGKTGEFVDPNNCNTTCCIAGWTVALFNDFNPIIPNSKRMYEDSIAKEATRLLDLHREQAVDLFFANPDSYWGYYEKELSITLNECDDLYEINNKQAAYVIRDIANGNLYAFNNKYSFVSDEDWDCI